MNIYAKAIDFSLTDAIKSFVENEMIGALKPVASKVGSVTARFKDINAARGGIDKRCSVVVELQGGGTVVVEETSNDLYSAIHKAARRLRRAALRAVRRPRSHERKDPIRPGTFGEPLTTAR